MVAGCCHTVGLTPYLCCWLRLHNLPPNARIILIARSTGLDVESTETSKIHGQHNERLVSNEWVYYIPILTEWTASNGILFVGYKLKGVGYAAVRHGFLVDGCKDNVCATGSARSICGVRPSRKSQVDCQNDQGGTDTLWIVVLRREETGISQIRNPYHDLGHAVHHDIPYGKDLGKWVRNLRAILTER